LKILYFLEKCSIRHPNAHKCNARYFTSDNLIFTANTEKKKCLNKSQDIFL
jgi:hypothetical protein